MRAYSTSHKYSPRYDTDVAGRMDVSGHDADLAGVGSDDAGAVGADEARLVLTQQMPLHFGHVLLRNALRDANNCGVRGSGECNTSLP